MIRTYQCSEEDTVEGSLPIKASTPQEAAERYVAGGDWPHSLQAWSVNVRVSVRGKDMGCHTVYFPPDEIGMLAEVRVSMPRQASWCGDRPDDHDWDYVGVAAGPGTTMIHESRCANCRLARKWTVFGREDFQHEHDEITYFYVGATDQAGEEK